MDDRQQLERAIAAQEQLRGIVDDEIVDITVASLRARLDGLGPSNQRRRQATVLFTDLQGFTSLAETLDPELVSDLMNDVWSRLDHIVTSFGGWIDKHIGDAVMALWGAEVVQRERPGAGGAGGAGTPAGRRRVQRLRPVGPSSCASASAPARWCSVRWRRRASSRRWATRSTSPPGWNTWRLRTAS